MGPKQLTELARQLYRDRLNQDAAFLSRDLPRRDCREHARAAYAEARAFAEVATEAAGAINAGD